MSFGNSSRLVTETQGGKPMIFWQQQNQPKSKKKFSYKKKEQKFPLRGKKFDEGSSSPPKDTTVKTALQTRSDTKVSKTKPTKNYHVPAANKQTDESKEKPSRKSDSTVTLTKAQLATIMDTIGALTAQNEELRKSTEFVAPISDTKADTNKETEEVKGEQNNATPEKGSSNTEPKIFEDQTTGHVPSSVNKETVGGSSAITVTQEARIPAVPPGNLSKAERKRLQWQKEKADRDALDNWNPWGRPGAGAPIKDDQGNVLADFNSRVEYVAKQQNSTQPGSPQKPPENQPVTSPNAASNKPQPAAIRSSFAIGVVEPDENRFQSAKDREKQEWLAELEKQREEKRLQKQREKEQHKAAPAETDTWAERLNTRHPNAAAEQAAAVSSSKPEHVVENRINSAPIPPVQEPQHQAATSATPQPSTNARGQNFLLDDATRRELEEKKKRAQEHQDAIRRQIEERERLKRQERERRIQEELAEEQKYLKEMDVKNNAGKDKRIMSQADRDEQTEKIRLAIEKAKEEADREKHKVRVSKLRQGGHDTSRLHASYEAKQTPREVGYVEPSYVPGLNPTPRDAMVDLAPAGHTVHAFHETTPRSQEPEIADLVSRESTDIIYEAELHPDHELPVIDKPPRGQHKGRKSPEAPRKKKGINDRPQWGKPKAEGHKKPVKQSERDPHYEQRMKRIRERKNQQQQQKENNRSKSHGQSESKASNIPVSTRHRVQSNSPPVPRLQLNTEQSSSRNKVHELQPSDRHVGGHHSRRDAPLSQRLPSPTTGVKSVRTNRARDTVRGRSPPVPTVKHKMEKYQDKGTIDAPKQNGDFVPFVRSQNVLDPAHADSPMPMSREATQVEKARMAYLHGHKPANFGTQMENHEDNVMRDQALSRTPRKDPFVNPGLVKDHPTGRQDLILQQLSDLRKGLMAKQRELEFNLVQAPGDLNIVA